MSWWRQHWRLGLALVVTGFGLFVTLLLYALHKKAEAEKLQVQLGLMNTSLKVSGLEADKTARAAELANNTTAAAELDVKILEAKKHTVAVVQNVNKLTDAEVETAFHRLGF